MHPATTVLVSVLSAFGGEKADFQPLGAGGSGAHSQAWGVSGDGRVVVGDFQFGTPFRWTAETGLVDLGVSDFCISQLTASARAADLAGDLVAGLKGYAGCSCFEGECGGGAAPGCPCWATFRWTAEGSEDIVAPEFCFGGTVLQTFTMSDDGGVMAGRTIGDDCVSFLPFRWTDDVGITVLPLHGSGDGFSGGALGVSREGNVVVGYVEGPGGRLPVRWVGDGEVEPLAAEGSSTADAAQDASAIGTVIVGTSSALDGGNVRAFIWTAETGALSLGLLDGGFSSSGAVGVSGDGEIVVGQCNGTAGLTGMIWDERNGMRNLRTLLEEATGLSLAGWRLIPTDISADGEVIVGWGTNPDGFTEAWRAVLPREATDPDTDGDGLLDSWETDGIPYLDADGVEQLYLLDWDQDGFSDANPLRRDIFVEVDAMEGTGIAPTMADLQPVIDAFDRAPVSNPGGIDGVQLHVQLSDLNLPLQSFPNNWVQFDALKAQWFGTAAEVTGDPATVEAILETKRKVYRYCIFGLKHGSDGSSGLAELPGNDFMVTIGDWTPPGGTPQQKAGTFMHELGHTLGLTHKGPLSQLSPEEVAGNDKHFNLKPNYYSIMNYNWQLPKSWHTPGSWPLASRNSGYSSAPLRMLDETDLVESEGLVPVAEESTYPAPGFKVPHNIEVDPTQPHDNRFALVFIGGTVDWNGDGTVEGPFESVVRDVNRVRTGWPSSPGTTLHGYADWPHLVYDFTGLPTFDPGVHGDTEEEMTFEDHLVLDTILPPNCMGDILADGSVDVADLLAMLAAWGPCVDGVVCVQDLDENGDVGVGDLLNLLAGWGPCP